jgi:CRP-like cAMP-binding protein
MSMPNPLVRLAALRGVPIFRGLTRSTLLQVAAQTREVRYQAGTTIVKEGEPGDVLCVITQGTVQVRKRDTTVAEMTVGDFFGEISLIDGGPRSATVVARDDVTLLTLSASDFRALLNTPYVARAALKSLASRLREAHASHDA